MTELRAKILQVVLTFVRNHYPEEEPFLAEAWAAFFDYVRQFETPYPEMVAADAILRWEQGGLGFSAEAMSDKAQLLLAIVAKAVCKTDEGEFSLRKLQEIVAKIVGQSRADGYMAKQLIEHLPQLLFVVQSGDSGPLAQLQSVTSRAPLFLINAEGKPAQLVSDIGNQKAHISDYLFWIDFTHADHRSLGKEKDHLRPTACSLLLFLTENIGISVPRKEVYAAVVGVDADTSCKWRNLLQNYITQLEKFCEEPFRNRYLHHDRLNDTLSLDESFRHKYFAYRVVR